MSHSTLHSNNESKKNHAFILRFMWDEETADWLIQLKPVDGGAPQQFTSPEALLFYLEAQTNKSNH